MYEYVMRICDECFAWYKSWYAIKLVHSTSYRNKKKKMHKENGMSYVCCWKIIHGWVMHGWYKVCIRQNDYVVRYIGWTTLSSGLIFSCNKGYKGW